MIQLLLRNLGWALLSLLLALAIWVAANMADNPVEQDEIRGVEVRVELPEGYVLTGRPDSAAVTAVVRASRSDWNLLLPEDILVTADLGDIREPGEYRVPLEARVAPPLHGRVVALRPSTWTLAIDRMTEQRMAVQVVVTNDPPLGYTYPADLSCEQTEVIVQGSADRVAEVARVEARLNLSNDRNPVSRTVNLTPVRANGQTASGLDLQLVPAAVTCVVDIRLREDVTLVEVRPDRGRSNPPPGYTFEGYTRITPPTVGVTGDEDAIAAMNQVIKTAPIDLSDKTETFTTEVPLALPEGVSLVTQNPLVTVTVIISPILGNREFESVPVEVVGLDMTRYRASGYATSLTVNVAGPQARLAALDLNDLRAVLDATGLTPGNYQLTPQVTIIGQTEDSPFTISDIVPDQVNVTIEEIAPTATAPRGAG